MGQDSNPVRAWFGQDWSPDLRNHRILIEPAAVVERRCLVKVNGVVTPSPVGVAMLKLKFVFEIYEDVEAAVKSFAWRPR